jgi:uncharacterized caspase-like protein
MENLPIAFAQRGMKPIGNASAELPDAIYRQGWALIVGINEYPNLPLQYQLEYAEADADSIAGMLQNKFGFDKNNIKVLKSEQATKHGILNALGSLANPKQVQQNDCVIIFFSGHGQTVPLPKAGGGGKMGFLIPCDAKVDLSEEPNPEQYYNYCIGMDELNRVAKLIPAKHVLFMVDACYSGLALASIRGGFSTKIPGYLTKVAEASTRQMITAGGEGEESVEYSGLGHGIFTYKVLEGLDKKLADNNNDGVITSLELVSYLGSFVPQMNPSNPQHPQYGREGEGEFFFLPQNVTDKPQTQLIVQITPPDAVITLESISIPTHTIQLSNQIDHGNYMYLAEPGDYRLSVQPPSGYKPYSEVITVGLSNKEVMIVLEHETYPLPPIEYLTPKQVMEYNEKGSNESFPSTLNFVEKRDENSEDLILLEEGATEIGPVKLQPAQRAQSIRCLEAWELAEFAAQKWSRESRLIYAIAGASSVLYRQTKGFDVRIYRWLFIFQKQNYNFLLVCIDPGPRITKYVGWVNEKEGFRKLDPIGEWKIDGVDALQTVLKNGAMPPGAIFLRMENNIPTWFIGFHGAHKVNAITGELYFDPLPEARKIGLIQEFKNDREETYYVYARHVKFNPEVARLPYNEFDYYVDFRTRVQLAYVLPNWITIFHYDTPRAWINGVPDSASIWTKSKGQLIAEAKLINYTSESIKVYETHYGKENTGVYEGTLTFDSAIGTKREEEAIKGIKEVEYYPIWPCSIEN